MVIRGYSNALDGEWGTRHFAWSELHFKMVITLTNGVGEKKITAPFKVRFLDVGVGKTPYSPPKINKKNRPLKS